MFPALPFASSPSEFFDADALASARASDVVSSAAALLRLRLLPETARAAARAAGALARAADALALADALPALADALPALRERASAAAQALASVRRGALLLLRELEGRLRADALAEEYARPYAQGLREALAEADALAPRLP